MVRTVTSPDDSPPAEVLARFETLAPPVRTACLDLRDLALGVAAAQPEIGPLTETLKWGEPAYLTEASGAGSTLRIWQTRGDERPALFVNCKTKLVARFQEEYPGAFDYVDDRAVILRSDVSEVAEEVKHCMALTFTYHRWK